jgi:hypothetical protein
VHANTKKTAAGMPRFLVRWLMRANDSAPPRGMVRGPNAAGHDTPGRVLPSADETADVVRAGRAADARRAGDIVPASEIRKKLAEGVS